MAERRGAIRWFAGNPVAANLIMILLLLGGLFMAFSIKQEVFPDFRLDVVRVAVPYPGASPSEVEQGIVVAVEEAVRGIDGVDRVTSAAMEGSGQTYVSLELESDPTLVLADVKNAVDRLTSLPEDSERPVVALVTNRFEVVSLIFHGDVSHATLRDIAENARDEMLRDPGISTVEVAGAPRREIAIEVKQSQLRAYGLTLDEIAARIAGTSLELPGGAIKTSDGEILLRTTERRRTAAEFETIPILTATSGTQVTLGDIADVRESFEDTDESALYDGDPALMLKVFRTGEQTPLAVAAVVDEHLERLENTLPVGVSVAKWLDWSEIYWQRIELLMRNAAIGLVLVLLILGLFLELRLAFWVTMGIPVSFLGALLFMPTLDVTVNMISLFAFIVVLGMVVDDAIVVGENIFELRQRGEKPLTAAVKGARGVAMPVCFAIATSVVAFLPMAFVPGFSGKLYRVIPAIVITVLIISLVESLWILPAHLAALEDPKTTGPYAAVFRQQQKVKRWLERLIEEVYAPTLAAVVRHRGASLATGIAILIAVGGFVKGGHIPFRFMPDIAGDVVIGSVEMPVGTSVEETKKVQAQLHALAQEILDENGEEGIVRGVFSQIGTPLPGDPGRAAALVPGGHITNVQIFFTESGGRSLETADFMAAWRERVGWIAGAERVKFEASIGPSPGPPVNVELRHNDMGVLDEASATLAARLREYPEVSEIDDGFSVGKPQLDLRITPEATSLGLSSADVARQVRSAFYGTEALRQQNGRDEVRVLVRLPRDERRTVHDVESMLLRTRAGGEIPVQEAADITSGRAYPVIKRADASRMVEVTAQVAPDTSPALVLASLEEGPLPDLLDDFEGLTYEFGGSQREQAKAMGSLQTGGALAMAAIFALLAIPFRSYVQPLIVMTAIPFGFVGALIGHVIMGFELSMISVMGLIALAGVVVNDSLVLIDAANENRRNGMGAYEAIHAAGVRRFRPILLTSLTTFFGLIPMITEQSVQAQFLVPMAISLGFGVLFATFVILLLVPALYMLLEDVIGMFRIGGPATSVATEPPAETAPTPAPVVAEPEAAPTDEPTPSAAMTAVGPQPGE